MKIKIISGVIYEQVDQEILICNPTADKVLMLNSSASIVWKLLVDHTEDNTDVEIVDEFISNFNIGNDQRERVMQDIMEILDNLRKENIIQYDSICAS